MIAMPTYLSYDAAELSYQEYGDGLPLLVIPGGPARDATYLGDLRALAGAVERRLVVPDLRGTGASRPATDAESHRADRIAADLATLVDHLQMGPTDVLGHSAGAGVALLLAERRPDLVARLLLVTPGTRAVGIGAEEEDWEAALALRADEPWHDDLRAALEADEPTPDQEILGSAVSYGRWDHAARVHAASDAAQRNEAATEWFFGDGAFDAGPHPRHPRRPARSRADPRRRAGRLAQRARCRRARRAVPRRERHGAARRRTLPLGGRPRGVRPRDRRRPAPLISQPGEGGGAVGGTPVDRVFLPFAVVATVTNGQERRRSSRRGPPTDPERAAQVERVATMSANCSSAVRTGPSGTTANRALASAARVTT